MGQRFTNLARATLASGVLSSATTLVLDTVANADSFPTANTGDNPLPAPTDWFKATLQDTAGNIEIVHVRTRTVGSTVLSDVLRGREGTSARTFATGAVVGLRVTAADMETAVAGGSRGLEHHFLLMGI